MGRKAPIGLASRDGSVDRKVTLRSLPQPQHAKLSRGVMGATVTPYLVTIAQLVERHPDTVEVAGSTPAGHTATIAQSGESITLTSWGSEVQILVVAPVTKSMVTLMNFHDVARKYQEGYKSVKITGGEFAGTVARLVTCADNKSRWRNRPSMNEMVLDLTPTTNGRWSYSRFTYSTAKYLVVEAEGKEIYIQPNFCEFLEGIQEPKLVKDKPVAPTFRDKYGTEVTPGCLIAFAGSYTQHVAHVTRITTKGLVYIKDFDEVDAKERRIQLVEGNVIVLNSELLDTLMLKKLSR